LAAEMGQLDKGEGNATDHDGGTDDLGQVG
jgi:hypothetical protein